MLSQRRAVDPRAGPSFGLGMFLFGVVGITTGPCWESKAWEDFWGIGLLILV